MNKTTFQDKNHNFSGLVKDEYDFKFSYEGVHNVFNSTNGNIFMTPFCDNFSYEYKPQEQCLLRDTPHGCQFGPYNTII
jgi:hypothetical protein